MTVIDAPNLQAISLLDPNTTMARAYLLMGQHKSPNLPVYCSNEVVGIVCARDIDALAERSNNDRVLNPLKVANFMRSPVKSADVDADIAGIAQRMLDESFNAIVIKNGADVIGALTKDDLLEILIETFVRDRRSLVDVLRTINRTYKMRRVQIASLPST